ncbi:hypothetical protein BATDEDRAFT_86533 [Batrachochytrium dendrobatidis JAM81]|uniref:Uncharacterized protein n=2 Tax=Batrachochytrium dendrobatidis TaxID=109871 RepID=F4NX62_BATDJ|nr:uncharacterized protein BATDEDRAFT_86533 [Batrachochytrium dendrobatidis JAM81]EGF82617.1 hypothetical protein BATDEDRAFT_86533 [Batrachochytrium dendrobatidis JAM81]OAJ40022.1 hypothetical protein BDEG_23802 [Batrachochytrium dendrobatidis JEL423]|eukprot:XP_006676991.1 hypothetical protein BATDEDRAFT_86533 [Batrachochytrium dendrobatidis JAM81]
MLAAAATANAALVPAGGDVPSQAPDTSNQASGTSKFGASTPSQNLQQPVDQSDTSTSGQRQRHPADESHPSTSRQSRKDSTDEPHSSTSKKGQKHSTGKAKSSSADFEPKTLVDEEIQQEFDDLKEKVKLLQKKQKEKCKFYLDSVKERMEQGSASANDREKSGLKHNPKVEKRLKKECQKAIQKTEAFKEELIQFAIKHGLILNLN